MWRLWALAKAGRADVIVKDLRQRWATMASVLQNNTLQEDWVVQPDSRQQWSHCAVVPLYIAFQGLAGIWPLDPGFRRMEIRPQLADLESLDLTVQTAPGPMRFVARGPRGERHLTLHLPAGSEGELIVREEERLRLELAPREAPPGQRRYMIPGGIPIDLELRYA